MPSDNTNLIYIEEKMSAYLAIMSQNNPNVYSVDEIDLEEGICSGLTTLWFYYRYRGKQQYFHEVLIAPIIDWDGRQETLSEELANNIEYLLSTAGTGLQGSIENILVLPGTPWERSSVYQSDCDVLIGLMKQDDYPDLRKEYEIAFVFKNEEFLDILQEISVNKLVRLSTFNHVIGFFF